MTCITDSLSIPRGATFAIALRIPDAFGDGFFTHHAVTSQMRTVGGSLVAPPHRQKSPWPNITWPKK